MTEILWLTLMAVMGGVIGITAITLVRSILRALIHWLIRQRDRRRGYTVHYPE